MDFWDFLQRWGPYSLVLLYLWLSSAFTITYLRTRQTYWRIWLSMLGMGVFMSLVLVTNSMGQLSTNTFILVLLLILPLLPVITYKLSPTKPTKRNKNPRPLHPHLLDVLLFRNIAATAGGLDHVEDPTGVQADKKRESTRWYAALGLVTTAIVLCGTVFFVGTGLQSCEWLDVNLVRSGCIRQFTYDGAIKAIDFSRDGQLVALGGSEHTTQIWNVHDGALVRTLSGHTDWIQQIAFSPDGRTVATASWDDTVRLWQLDNGSVLHVMKVEGAARSIARMAYSPDGKALAVTTRGTGDRTLWLWRVEDGSLIRNVDTASNVLAFTPDGTQLVTTDEKGDLTFTAVTNGDVVRTIDTPGVALDAWISPDGNQIAFYSGPTLYILRADNGATVKEIEIGELYGIPTSMSPNWEYFVATGPTDNDQELAVWNVTYANLVKRWIASKYSAYDLTFAPDSRSIAVATSWQKARVWRVP